MLTLEDYEKLNPRGELADEGMRVVYGTPPASTKRRVDNLFEEEPMTPAFSQGCILVRLDDLIETGAVPMPDHIQIDVDGIERRIVAGARRGG